MAGWKQDKDVTQMPSNKQKTEEHGNGKLKKKKKALISIELLPTLGGTQKQGHLETSKDRKWTGSASFDKTD